MVEKDSFLKECQYLETGNFSKILLNFCIMLLSNYPLFSTKLSTPLPVPGSRHLGRFCIVTEAHLGEVRFLGHTKPRTEWPSSQPCGGFQLVMGYPYVMDWFISRENPNLKWMMTGGPPIYGNPHVEFVESSKSVEVEHVKTP